MGDGVVMLAPLVGLGGAERVATLVDEIVIVDHDFKQLNDGGELTGAKMAEQFMRRRFERANDHKTGCSAAGLVDEARVWGDFIRGGGWDGSVMSSLFNMAWTSGSGWV